MPRTRKGRATWAAMAAATALIASGLVLTSSTAAQGADPQDLCNSAHPMDDAPEYSQPADGWPLPVPGDPGGMIHVFYEPDYGYNCAIVVSNGGPTYIDIGLRRSDGTGERGWDDKTAATVAGPVLIPAQGFCVDVTAAVGERSFTSRGTNCNA
ncbi:hypothetical protein H4W79_002346 [Nocardiopsis terrae]|uniref:Peptidase inhibitor family I36 n=1 Tax=Nocardiopsis terrae TaxID=372655 RepID=A0ABR9HGP0_9ACTN|nr:hypothetical protein [Nocardiopsis terrae]MBE1458132.1 hypothetical protein [Nocardiopsis terrae]